MAKEHVSVKGLAVEFNERVLEDVFLQMRKGEFVSIVGKSGSGKTTFLNALAGLVPVKGEIRRPKQLAMVFQNYSLFPWMNIKENIAFGLKENDEKKAQEIIEKIGLCGKEYFYPKQLSGGQQQRVAIGRAIAAKPELILLDEPFANLDSFSRMQMQDWLNGIANESKTTTILVTHDVDEAILLSDRVFVLKDKSLQQEFTIPFTKPRKNEIRYDQLFQELKKEIIKSI
ncbi:Trehalose/maltose import ATP-binding protein MalK [uncultured archaeon]|nr:Trehalose/maltose import ATP-binding protein MalK [uncultured archaeon]